MKSHCGQIIKCCVQVMGHVLFDVDELVEEPDGSYLQKLRKVPHPDLERISVI